MLGAVGPWLGRRLERRLPLSAPRPYPPRPSDRRRPGARRSAALVLHPPKLVPMDPEHEQEAVDALTELFVQLLERDTGRDANS
jgi:hypothetical protein